METEKYQMSLRRQLLFPLHKGKGSKDECNDYRGISLLSVPGKSV